MAINPNGAAVLATLHELLAWRALHQPDKQAYSFLVDGETHEQSLTYAELERRARRIAARLQSLCMAGERVLLLYPPGLEYIAALFGCFYAGAVAVPAYPPRAKRPMPRLQAIAADARARVALTSTALLSALGRRLPRVPALQGMHWLATDRADDSPALSWQAPATSRDSLALLQYTSGSTATPKGVMLTHGNLLDNLGVIHRCFEHTPESRGVIWLPPYHDMGLIGGILQPLYGGFPVVLMSPMDVLRRPYRWLWAISRYRGSTSGGPNFAYDLCVRRITPAQRAGLDLRSWEVAFNGAEPVRQATIERFVEAFAACGFRREAFYPCYGLAEATLMVSGGLKAAPPVYYSGGCEAPGDSGASTVAEARQPLSTLVGCGRPLPEARSVVIVDPDTLTPCPPQHVGEIWVASPSVAQGYWNRPEETVRTFQAYLAGTGTGPFLRTGDLGLLHDGELFVTGRLKEVIIIGGRNHYPQDLEATVERCHPALRPGCGAAFAVDVEAGEALVIVQEVERQHRKHVTKDEIVAAIHRAVARRHGVPVYAVVLLKPGSLPKTSSGKVQRLACRGSFLSGSLSVWEAPAGNGRSPGGVMVGTPDI